MKARQVLEQRGHVLNELVQGRVRRGRRLMHKFRKLMIQCGIMVSGLRCGS